jgi:hypothetical protein
MDDDDLDDLDDDDDDECDPDDEDCELTENQLQLATLAMNVGVSRHTAYTLAKAGYLGFPTTNRRSSTMRRNVNAINLGDDPLPLPSMMSLLQNEKAEGSNADVIGSGSSQAGGEEHYGMDHDDDDADDSPGMDDEYGDFKTAAGLKKGQEGRRQDDLEANQAARLGLGDHGWRRKRNWRSTEPDVGWDDSEDNQQHYSPGNEKYGRADLSFADEPELAQSERGQSTEHGDQRSVKNCYIRHLGRSIPARFHCQTDITDAQLVENVQAGIGFDDPMPESRPVEIIARARLNELRRRGRR